MRRFGNAQGAPGREDGQSVAAMRWAFRNYFRSMPGRLSPDFQALKGNILPGSVGSQTKFINIPEIEKGNTAKLSIIFGGTGKSSKTAEPTGMFDDRRVALRPSDRRSSALGAGSPASKVSSAAVTKKAGAPLFSVPVIAVAENKVPEKTAFEPNGGAPKAAAGNGGSFSAIVDVPAQIAAKVKPNVNPEEIPGNSSRIDALRPIFNKLLSAKSNIDKFYETNENYVGCDISLKVPVEMLIKDFSGFVGGHRRDGMDGSPERIDDPETCSTMVEEILRVARDWIGEFCDAVADNMPNGTRTPYCWRENLIIDLDLLDNEMPEGDVEPFDNKVSIIDLDKTDNRVVFDQQWSDKSDAIGGMTNETILANLMMDFCNFTELLGIGGNKAENDTLIKELFEGDLWQPEPVYTSPAEGKIFGASENSKVDTYPPSTALSSKVVTSPARSKVPEVEPALDSHLLQYQRWLGKTGQQG